jgi:hypothetical protein
VALQLMRAGFRRVSVVRGGLPAMLDAGVAVAPKDVTAETTAAVSPREGGMTRT